MPWSGGTFTPLWQWVVDAVTYPNMLPSRFDLYGNDDASGINNCIAKDGQNAAVADLPMGGFRHTNVGASGGRTQYAQSGQVQDGSFTSAVDAGAADAYVVTLSPAVPLAYTTGMTLCIKIANTNTGASTLNVNALGAKSIKNGGTTAVTAGQIEASKAYWFQYDGTNFQILGVVPAVSSEFADSLFRVTGSSDATKKLAFEVDGLTTATTRTVTIPDASGTLAYTANIPTSLPIANNGYRTNYFYLSGNGKMSTGGGTLPANMVNYSPIQIGASDTFTRIGVRAVTGGATNARLGIYNCANGVATTLVLDAGAVSLAATGDVEITISQALTPGIYMLACNFSNTTAVLGYQDSSVVGYLNSFVTGLDTSTSSSLGTVQSLAFGALPSPAGTQTIANGSGVPIMWLRKV